MKVASNLLILLGSIFGTLLFPSSLFAEEASAPAGSTTTETEVLAYLDSVIVKEVNFSGLKLSKALAQLEGLMGEDSDIRIVKKGPESSDPKLNISLRNVSMARVLEFVCQQVNYAWSIQGGAIVVEPSDSLNGVSADGLKTRIRGSSRGPVDSFSAPFVARANFSYAAAAPPARRRPPSAAGDFNTEEYEHLQDNPFRSPRVAPLSTFSIDVDTASYANVRRFLSERKLPPVDAVRIEELVNYFGYDYAPPERLPDAPENDTKLREVVAHPFAVHTEVGEAFWQRDHKVLKIGLKGYEVDWDDRPSTNLVFLLDVSGSMNSPKKLPLVKDALELLVRKLDERDRVAIVVYAGAAGLVLPSTTANNTETILHALENLKAGGSTAGGQGIQLAYDTAERYFRKGGVNRVILCTDGDFNVGVSDTGSLTRMVEAKAKSGIFLTVCGFGRGNLNDELLETISNKGNGSYAYIDGEAEARRAFSQGAAGSVLTIAKDVKIQVEFNPAKVKAYRLIGYENRMLAAEDFNDDTKDAGELGSGHTVTALYEIAPTGSGIELPEVDDLKYQVSAKPANGSSELATVKLRYKWAEDSESQLLTKTVEDRTRAFEDCPEDFRFSSAVAAWGMLLRESPHKGEATIKQVRSVVGNALGVDSGGLRSEFLRMVETTAKRMKEKAKADSSE